jgi:chromosome segregation ATPase
MKKRMHNKTLVLVALTAGAAWLLTGCGTSRGYKQADKTGAGIAEFREEITNGKKAIDATMTSLGAVATSANSDPRKPFEQFSKDVANLESTANKIKKRAEDMRAQGQAYFDQWEKQLAEVKNPEIQRLAAERKAKLKETFESVKKYTEPLKAQFEPWMSDLKDLQKYLSNDLTVAGVDAAKSLFTKTTEGGLEVQKSMDGLVSELNTIAATITPAKAGAESTPPPAAPPAKQ